MDESSSSITLTQCTTSQATTSKSLLTWLFNFHLMMAVNALVLFERELNFVRTCMVRGVGVGGIQKHGGTAIPSSKHAET